MSPEGREYNKKKVFISEGCYSLALVFRHRLLTEKWLQGKKGNFLLQI